MPAAGKGQGWIRIQTAASGCYSINPQILHNTRNGEGLAGLPGAGIRPWNFPETRFQNLAGHASRDGRHLLSCHMSSWCVKQGHSGHGGLSGGPRAGPRARLGTFVGDRPQHQSQGLRAAIGGQLAAAGEPKFLLTGTKGSLTGGGWLGGQEPGPTCHRHPGSAGSQAHPFLRVLTRASVKHPVSRMWSLHGPARPR